MPHKKTKADIELALQCAQATPGGRKLLAKRSLYYEVARYLSKLAGWLTLWVGFLKVRAAGPRTYVSAGFRPSSE